MSTSSQASTRPADRQERFRAFLKRFSPTAPPIHAIQDGLVVEQPSAVFIKAASRAVLEPGIQQLIAGGIGSGKTTELLLAERWLAAQPRTIPVYIDVSAETDLGTLNPGAVLASLGLRLLNRAEEHDNRLPELASIEATIKGFAFGKTEEVWVPYEDWSPTYSPDDEDWEPPPGEYVKRKIHGKLQPRFPPLNRDIDQFARPLRGLTDSIRSPGTVLVAIFDGLDRVMAPERFWEVVYQDFRQLKSLQVSVLAAAPLAILFGQARPIADYFEGVYHLSVNDPAVSRFPMEILERRGADDLIAPQERESLCRASGGVLRDLISLVRNSAGEAYISGSDRIEEGHVVRAIRQLGEAYLLGLGEQHLRILRKLRAGGGFAAEDSSSMELLVTRRVLEYHDPNPRYVVHPAVAPLLDETGDRE